MGEADSAFTTGDYHANYETRGRNTEERLTRSYRRALELVEEQGWDNPLKRETPHVLQCGTGAARTTSTFVDFVLSANPNAKISVLDLSDKPLNAAKTKIAEEKGASIADAIDFIQANALATGLPDASVDMIETDYFLQFFSPGDKKRLIEEWSRILKPGGVITTRDYVQREGNVATSAAEKVLDKGRRTYIKRHLGPKAYKTSTTELSLADYSETPI